MRALPDTMVAAKTATHFVYGEIFAHSVNTGAGVLKNVTVRKPGFLSFEVK